MILKNSMELALLIPNAFDGKRLPCFKTGVNGRMICEEDCNINGSLVKKGDALIAVQGVSVLFVPIDSIQLLLAVSMINTKVVLTFHKDIKSLPINSLQARRSQVPLTHYFIFPIFYHLLFRWQWIMLSPISES